MTTVPYCINFREQTEVMFPSTAPCLTVRLVPTTQSANNILSSLLLLLFLFLFKLFFFGVVDIVVVVAVVTLLCCCCCWILVPKPSAEKKPHSSIHPIATKKIAFDVSSCRNNTSPGGTLHFLKKYIIIFFNFITLTIPALSTSLFAKDVVLKIKIVA